MRIQQNETPPSSVNGDDEISALEGEDFIYIGDADEVLGMEDDGANSDSADSEESVAREPPREDAKVVFKRHVGSVFSCDLHPNGKVAVTGGEDDKAFAWEVENGRTVFEVNGHKDSVIFVGFSFDGSYLATADMAGGIKVFKTNLEGIDTPEWPLVWEYEAGDLTWGQWHYGARVLIFGAASGEIYVFKIPSGETKVLQGHGSKVDCGKMFPDGRRLAAGYEDGTIKIWDLKSKAVAHHIQPDAHQDGITGIDTHPDNNLLITISTAGKVLLTTASTGKVVGQIDTEGDLETVAFCKDPELNYFALGTLTGAVSIWDVSRQMLRHQCCSPSDESPAGVTKVLWSERHLITACLDGSVRIYAARSGRRVHALTGHMSEVLDMCYNAQEKLILTTSDDEQSRIFKFDDNEE